MSKIKKSDLENPVAVNADNGHYMGIGYYIPSGYDARQVQKLFNEWNEKLKKSGHKDIEHYSGFSVGRVSPRIKSSHAPIAENSGSLYNIQLVDTYLTNYFEHRTPGDAQGRKYYAVDVFLLRCFCSGVDLGTLIRLFAKPTKKLVIEFHNRWPDIATQIVWRHKGKSKFWIYQRTKTALAHCYAWHLTDINGELTRDDVNFYRLYGIDSKATETILNKALEAKGLEPIKLKWEKKTY